ncbi:HdeD family acid-resistance protein [Puia sp. P3]|uniref:HdeD family acid-resistance protein n=1 Tax=Puia sp. P3 TaxID=3423952 RepID=UPI003D669418
MSRFAILSPNACNHLKIYQLGAAPDRGGIFVGIGILAFINPLSGYVKLTKFAGIGLLLNGGLLLAMVILRPVPSRESKWLQVESAFHLFFGLLFVFNPLLAFIALPYFIGSWMLMVGILKILAAIALRKLILGRGFIMAAGLLSTLFGSLLLFSPFARASSITILIGAFGVTMGCLYIIDALRYRRRPDNVDVMF